MHLAVTTTPTDPHSDTDDDMDTRVTKRTRPHVTRGRTRAAAAAVTPHTPITSSRHHTPKLTPQDDIDTDAETDDEFENEMEEKEGMMDYVSAWAMSCAVM